VAKTAKDPVAASRVAENKAGNKVVARKVADVVARRVAAGAAPGAAIAKPETTWASLTTRPGYKFTLGDKETQMNAFALLKADHEKVAGILETIENTTERALKGREEIFARLKEELDLHAAIEEEIFYPALEDAEETRDITLEAYEEHRLVKQLLSELEAAPKDSEEWTAKFTVLKENIEHHVEEEEGEMFKKARQALSDEEIEALGERLQEAKQQGRAAGAR
jgi:hemerythrin-like domain-containing protein